MRFRKAGLSSNHLSLTGWFLLVCLPVVVIASTALVLAYRDAERSTVVATAEEMARTELKLLANAVWPEFGAFLLGPAAGQTPDAIDQRTHDIWARVEALARDSNLLKVKVYNLDGITVFSTAFDEIGRDYAKDAGFLSARSGDRYSEHTQRDRVQTLQGRRQDVEMLGVYAPIRAGGPESEIVAVIELYIDMNRLAGAVEGDLRSQIVYGMIPLVLMLTVLICLAVLRTAEKRTRREFYKRMRVLQQARDARDADRSKSEFLANMSHELRTPLNAIMGYAEAIALQQFGPNATERYRDYADTILSAGRHLLSIVNDILDLSRVEAGKMPVRTGTCSVAEVVNQVSAMLMHLAASHNVKLTADVPYTLPTIETDTDKLRQCLINIISNSIKFSDEEGAVRISATAGDDGSVTLVCRDDGVGMSMDQIAIALKPFGQVSDVYARKIHGAGLGLPLTKRFVELIGGVFEIESQPGAGTTVRLHLPARCVVQDIDEAA